LNRWVFKWRLKVRMYLHSQMSAGREFQVDGAATEKAQRASSVSVRGTTISEASKEHRAGGGARVCTSLLRYVAVPSAVCHQARHRKTMYQVLDMLLLKSEPTTFLLRAAVHKRGLCCHAVSVYLSVCHVRGSCQNE